MNISRGQQLAWANKQAKGFNTADALKLGLLTAEVGEALTARRKHLPDYTEELADVFILLVGLAQTIGIGLLGRRVEE